MKKIRLGVNIDHVSTVRNARGEKYPSPLRAAVLAQESGADSVTIHLREDRRHINDLDLKSINKKLKIPYNGLALCICLFYIWMALSISRSPSPVISLSMFVWLSIFPLCFFIYSFKF